MKHTDFYALVNDIKRKEQQELYRALEAHGGSYSWWNAKERCFCDDEYPIIAANVDGYYPSPMDINVRSIFIEDGILNIIGESNEYGELIDLTIDEVFAGHIEYIIDLIPETESINDVTIIPEDFAIPISVSRADLEDVGFNSDNISSQTMEDIASCMADSYFEFNYLKDLKMAAKTILSQRKETYESNS